MDQLSCVAKATLPNSFIHDMLTGISDLYHFIALSSMMTLADGCKVQFLLHFSVDQDEIVWCWSNSS